MLFIGTLSHAQKIEDALKLTENEQFDDASKAYRTLISKFPTNANFYYYAGDNFFKNDENDSAKIYFDKGLSINPGSALNLVGLGSLAWVDSNFNKAKDYFNQALALQTGKNIDVEVAQKIAEAYIYYPTKNLDEAIRLLDLAEKAKPKNFMTKVLKGDAIWEKDVTNAGPSIQLYQTAQALDANHAISFVKEGRAWLRNRSYERAEEKFNEAMLIEPNFAPVYREMGDMKYILKDYDMASANYQKYLSLNANPSAYRRYIRALYTAKKYDEAIATGEKTLELYPDQLGIYALIAYAYAEKENTTPEEYAKANTYLDKFFEKAGDKARAVDWFYRYKIYSKTNNDSLAFLSIKKAMSMPNVQCAWYSDYYNLQYRMRLYNEVIQTLNDKAANATCKGLSLTDNFMLARANYFLNNYVIADTLINRIVIAKPDFITGYVWLAKIRDKQDTGKYKTLAKVHYEKFLSSLKPEDISKNKVDYLNSNSYLAVYYYYATPPDYATASTYFKAIYAIDTLNKNAINFFNSKVGKEFAPAGFVFKTPVVPAPKNGTKTTPKTTTGTKTTTGSKTTKPTTTKTVTKTTTKPKVVTKPKTTKPKTK